jgi:hypothetical protein
MGGRMKEFIESIMHNDRVWDSVKVDGIEKEQFTYSDTADYFVQRLNNTVSSGTSSAQRLLRDLRQWSAASW